MAMMEATLDSITITVEDTIVTQITMAMETMVEVVVTDNQQALEEDSTTVMIEDRVASDTSMSVKEADLEVAIIIREVITTSRMVASETTDKEVIVITRDKRTQVHHMIRVMMHLTSSHTSEL